MIYHKKIDIKTLLLFHSREQIQLAITLHVIQPSSICALNMHICHAAYSDILYYVSLDEKIC